MEEILSLVLLVDVLLRINSLFQLPGLWVPEAVAVVTRKAEWVGW